MWDRVREWKGLNMPYVTFLERYTEEKAQEMGRDEGRIEGRLEAIEAVL